MLLYRCLWLNTDRSHNLLLCFKTNHLRTNVRNESRVISILKKYRVSEQFAMCFGTSCTGLAVPSRAGVVSALYTNCVIYILLLGCYIVQYPRKIFFITPERTYPWSEKKWKIEVKKTPNRRDSSHLNNPQPSFRVPKRNQCQGEIRVYYLRKSMFAR